MIFTISKTDLKSLLQIASLATDSKMDVIQSHALFQITGGRLTVYATDKDRIAFSSIPIDCQENGFFTMDPKKVQDLLSNTDLKEIKIQYLAEQRTLKIYASESEASYVSFPSLDPQKFCDFQEDLGNLRTIKTVRAGALIYGLKYINGFLPKDDKEKLFSGLYISNGYLFGANGHNKIGAFQHEDLDGIDTLFFRRPGISQMISLIDITDKPEMNLSSSSKMVGLITTDGSAGVALLKSSNEMPKFPINLVRPDNGGISVNRNMLIKKISRISTAQTTGITVIKAQIRPDGVEMETCTERSSKESLTYRVLGESLSDAEFYFDGALFKTVLVQFDTEQIDLYVSKNIHIFAEAELESEEKDKGLIRSPFRTVAVISLSRKRD